MISLNSISFRSAVTYRDFKLCLVLLIRADIINYGNAFNLTMYLKNETDYIVWDRLASSIAYVRDMLSGDASIYLNFQVSRVKQGEGLSRPLQTLQTSLSDIEKKGTNH